MNHTSRASNIKDIALEKPFCFSLTVFTFFLVIFYALSALEILPEHGPVEWPEAKEKTTIGRGDNLIWLGMEVAPLSRSIRKEFNIPGKVKGVFVLDEGKGEAKKQGVRTGDVICSINRKKISGQRSLAKVAGETKYYDGILIDIYREKKNIFVTIPFPYTYGPLLGPNKGHWQLGSPVEQQLLPYGEMMQGR